MDLLKDSYSSLSSPAGKSATIISDNVTGSVSSILWERDALPLQFFYVTGMAAVVRDLRAYICRSTEHDSCVTLIRSNLAVTFSHGRHQTLLLGSTLTLRRIARMDAVDRTGTVVHIDERDLILLDVDPPFQIPDLNRSAPEIGEKYYLLGLSPSNKNLSASMES